MLTIQQQRKAVNYTLVFLKNEIKSIKRSIEKCVDERSKTLLTERHDELIEDLEEFEQIGDRC